MKIDKISTTSFGPGSLIKLRTSALDYSGTEFLVSEFVVGGRHNRQGVVINGIIQNGSYADCPATLLISRTGQVSLELAPATSPA